MASITMASSSSFAATATAATVAERPSARPLVVRAAKAESAGPVKAVRVERVDDKSSPRRMVMFAAAAAAVAAISRGNAMAEADEPKSGSDEAKKKYAQICVTMPTARVCRK